MSDYVRCAFLCGLAAFSVSSPARGGTLYSQPFDSPGGGFSYVGYAETADQFTLAASGVVRSVSWYGSLMYGVPPGAPGSTGVEYTIRFFQDDGGKPSDAYFSQTVATPVSSYYGSYDDAAVYWNRANLDDSVALTGGTTYWLSIMGPADREWIWSVASQTEGDVAYFRFLNPLSPLYNQWRSMDYTIGRANEAFALHDDAIPEPASFLLAVAAIAVFAWRARHKLGGRAAGC